MQTALETKIPAPCKCGRKGQYLHTRVRGTGSTYAVCMRPCSITSPVYPQESALSTYSAAVSRRTAVSRVLAHSPHACKWQH